MAADPAAAVGNGLTVTVTLFDLTQLLPLVSVTVYVVVDVGLALGLDTEASLNPVEGLHEYELPDTDAAPIDNDDPLQIVADDPAAATGNGLTVTVTLFDLTQLLPLVSVTVYVVVDVGLALGLDTDASLRPVDGLQLYELPDTDADPIDTDDPLQIVAFDPAAAVGN